MASIAELLADLGKDDEDAPARRAEFVADRRGYMASRGFTEGQQDIVMSGDLLVIRNALRYEFAKGLVPGRGYTRGGSQPIVMMMVWTPRPPPPPPEDEDSEQS
jgi:hypothetical protein